MKMAGEKVFHLDVLSVKLNEDFKLAFEEPLDCPPEVSSAAMKILKDRDREAVVVFNLNAAGIPASAHVASVGTLNSSLAHPRELLKASILSNANSIIIGHNHPSGSTEPSREDIELTRRMTKLCSLIQIPLVDHVIIAGGNSCKYFSMFEKGIIKRAANGETYVDEKYLSQVAERSFNYGTKVHKRRAEHSKVR